MTTLWFDRDLGPVVRRGALLYAPSPEGVWAVLSAERTYPEDIGEESDQLLGLYGAAVHGIGHLMLGDGVPLPDEFTAWATAPTVPMAQLSRWEPVLLSVDGSAQLALARTFDRLRVVTTTLHDVHLTVVTPSDAGPVVLRHLDDLDVPPPGSDGRGG